jgi:hypothetical protein
MRQADCTAHAGIGFAKCWRHQPAATSLLPPLLLLLLLLVVVVFTGSLTAGPARLLCWQTRSDSDPEALRLASVALPMAAKLQYGTGYASGIASHVTGQAVSRRGCAGRLQ